MTVSHLSPHRPTVDRARELVTRLYSGEDPCTRGTGPVGGHLHIVLDDGNLANHHVDFCLLSAMSEKCATCTELAHLLMAMSRTQRAKLYKGPRY